MTDSERKRLFERARREVLKKRTAIHRDTAAEIVRLLKLAQARIRETLANAPSDYQQWRLPQLQAQIAQRLAEFERVAGRAGTAGAAQAWAAGEQLVAAPLTAAGLGGAGVATGIDPRTLTAMQQFMTDRIKGLATAAIDKINTELGLVILGVQSPSEAIGKVEKILGKDSRQRAITIVRTEVGRAFSAATQQRLEAAQAQVPGLKKLWRRSGKVHSRPQHDAIDGQVREIDEAFEVIDPRTGAVIEIYYPRDPKAPLAETINCGCESLPFMESWESFRRTVPFTERELPASELARNPVKAAFAARARRADRE